MRGWTALTTPPWRRAPRLLVGQPIVFLAIVLAAAVLAVAAASGPLFLAAAGTAALHVDAAAACPESSLPSVSDYTDGPTVAADDRSVRAALRGAGLPDPYLVTFGGLTLPRTAAGNAVDVTLYGRSGALAHVRKEASAGGRGVWLPDDFARLHGLHPGQILHAAPTPDPGDPVGPARIRLRVAGIYASLTTSGFVASVSLPRYWCNWSHQIVPSLETQPPPLLITDVGTARSVLPGIDAHWFAPIGVGRMTLPQAAAAVDKRATAATALLRAGLIDSTTGRLPTMIGHSKRVRGGLRGSVVPIDVGGSIVALLLVAGAGGFWGLRRERELRLLSSRGVGPGMLAVKAVLEVAPAMLVGAAAGWAGALALVRALGPSGVVEVGAARQAALAAGGAAVVGLIVIAAIARVVTRERTNRRRGRALLRAIPWEIALVGAAIGTYQLVRRHGAVSVAAATVRLNPWVLAFPLFALAGCLLLAARLARLGTPMLVGAARRGFRGLFSGDRDRGIASYLASRRISGTPIVAVALAIGTALPCGILTYSATITNVLDNNVHSKYETYVGADHALSTLASPHAAINTGGHGTVVSVLSAQTMIENGQEVAVLGVEPASFARFASRGAQLKSMLDKLNPVPHQPVPALLINGGALTPHTLTLRNTELPIRVVGRTNIFPGLRDGYMPLLVVDRRTLASVDWYVNRVEEVWTSNRELTACLATLRRRDVEVFAEVTPRTFLGSSGLLPITWVFGYLRALAVLTGLVALSGLIFALTSRTRRRTTFYVLARRMGLTKRTHRRSLVLELTGVLGLGWIGGIGLSLGAAALVFRLLNLDRIDPPAPVFATPFTTLAITLAATMVAIGGAAMITQYFADRAHPGEIMRLD